MWKLNAGLEGLLPLGMEIALPHVISHAKALLSTFTSFASFPIKSIHGGTVLLGRWIHFHPLTGTDSVRACEISHTGTINSGDLQSFTMSCMYYLPLALLLFTISSQRMPGHTYRIYINIYIYICVAKAETEQLMDVKKKGPLTSLRTPFFSKYYIKSINAAKKQIERRNGTDGAVQIDRVEFDSQRNEVIKHNLLETAGSLYFSIISAADSHPQPLRSNQGQGNEVRTWLSRIRAEFQGGE